MMKKKKDLADEKPVDQQIAELQRKFRVLENDKRAYSEDSQGIIRKQRATIEKLTRENRKMKAELNETRAPGATGPEMRMGLDKLSKLGDMHDGLQEKFDEQTDLARDLKEKIETAQRRVHQARHEQGAQGGVNASLENSKAVGKQIRILENRLDQALQKFNQAIAMNRKLREEIDTLRGERMVFDDIYRKLENELQMKKKEMAFIIEQANAAYEARDSAQAQMAALKQQADKEHAEFEKEWRELGRLIENDKKMKEFMRQKVKQAAESGVDSPKGEDKARKKITQNAWNTAGSLVRISAHQEKVASYEEAFAKIQAATGIDDIDVLVSTFVSAEDQNYSLFKYNNELSADIEKLELTIGEHKEEHVTLSGTSNRKEDTEHAKLLETLEEKWRDVDKKALHYELKCTETQQAVNQIRQSIQAIFLRVGCTPDDLPAGAGSGISDQNMMLYLGVIEQKTNELMKLHDQWKADEDDDGVDAHKTRPVGASNLQIKLPSTVEDYSDNEDDDEDDDQRPFTRDELKTKTTRAISRKQKKKGKGGQNPDKA